MRPLHFSPDVTYASPKRGRVGGRVCSFVLIPMPRVASEKCQSVEFLIWPIRLKSPI